MALSIDMFLVNVFFLGITGRIISQIHGTGVFANILLINDASHPPEYRNVRVLPLEGRHQLDVPGNW